jgi:hypothetical protein
MEKTKSETVRFKTIKLLPTLWSLDAYLVDKHTDDNRATIASDMVTRYGANYECYYEELEKINCVINVSATKKSKSKGESRIIMIVEYDLKTIVHELLHVLQHLSNLSGVEMSYDAQEWQACMIEYLYGHFQDFDSIPVLK